MLPGFAVVVLVGLVGFSACAVAQEAPTRVLSSEDTISGILVNQTVSQQGWEFYRSFADAWREKADAEKFTLEINERFSRRSGNLIWITNGPRRLFVGTLPFKMDRVRPFAEQAAETSYSNMLSLLLPLEGGPDLDLGRDEW